MAGRGKKSVETNVQLTVATQQLAETLTSPGFKLLMALFDQEIKRIEDHVLNVDLSEYEAGQQGMKLERFRGQAYGMHEWRRLIASVVTAIKSNRMPEVVAGLVSKEVSNA